MNEPRWWQRLCSLLLSVLEMVTLIVWTFFTCIYVCMYSCQSQCLGVGIMLAKFFYGGSKQQDELEPWTWRKKVGVGSVGGKGVRKVIQHETSAYAICSVMKQSIIKWILKLHFHLTLRWTDGFLECKFDVSRNKLHINWDLSHALYHAFFIHSRKKTFYF